MTNILKTLTTIAALSVAVHSVAQQHAAHSYLDPAVPFENLQPVSTEAEAWAMCAAVYSLIAQIYGEVDPATAQHSTEMSNDAVIAVAMTFMAEAIANEATPEEMDATWAQAQQQSNVLPDRSVRWVLNHKVGLENSVWLEELNYTLQVCAQNIEAQQLYVAAFREVYPSGPVVSAAPRPQGSAPPGGGARNPPGGGVRNAANGGGRAPGGGGGVQEASGGSGDN